VKEVKFHIDNGRLDLTIAEQFTEAEQKDWFASLLSQLESRFVAMAGLGSQVDVDLGKFEVTVTHNDKVTTPEAEQDPDNPDTGKFEIVFCENYHALEPKAQAALYRRFIAGMMAVEQRLQ
jgi:hypothetical protein